MKYSQVTNQEARSFLADYFVHREINREFFIRVTEKDFDFRMVDTPQRKATSIREQLAHQINVQSCYLKGLKTGQLIFSKKLHDLSLKTETKKELLAKLKQTDQELINLLSIPKNLKKKIKVPWSKERIDPISMLYGLQNHEILHTGVYICLMDHLNMPRFKKLKQIWG
ncbi:DinB family protein [Patescibacteria group bacterium]